MAEMRQGKDYDPNENNENQRPKKKKPTPNNTSKNAPSKKVIIALGSIVGVIVLIVGIAYAYSAKGDTAGGVDTVEKGKGGFFSGLFGSNEIEINPEDEFLLTDPTEDLGDFAYTDEEYQSLVDVGYTAEQIADFEFNMYDAGAKVAEYAEYEKQLIYDNFPELRDEAKKTGSKEYEELLNKTYLSLKPFTLKAAADGTTFLMASTAKETVPYEKLGSRGYQNFVKINSYTYGSLFTQVDPQLYADMRDKGSIVADYTVYKDVNGKEVISGIKLEIIDYTP